MGGRREGCSTRGMAIVGRDVAEDDRDGFGVEVRRVAGEEETLKLAPLKPKGAAPRVRLRHPPEG